MRPTTDIFNLTNTQEKYLDEQLNRVSRSFALVIPFLEKPLQHYLATAYLLCRVVDNIEDCVESYHWKEKRFAEYTHLLHEPHLAPEVLAVWDQAQWAALSDGERALMGVATGSALWEVYAQIPTPAREIIAQWVGAMAEGMRQVCSPTAAPLFVNHSGIQVLATQADYDSYCYYVAGTVGHLATELVARHYHLSEDIVNVLRLGADACGRSAQKTNIVKDFAEDLNRGFSYLPYVWMSAADYRPLECGRAPPEWTAMVLNNVVDELREATEYLVALPYNATGYRQSSLLCLLPAYETILLAARSQATLFTSRHQVKISRLTMARCLADARLMLSDNKAILAYSRRLESEIKTSELSYMTLQV